MLRPILVSLLIGVVSMMGACSQNKRDPQDPLEGLNREFFGLNKTLDRALIKPVAYVYLKYLPQPIQMGVGNFYDNLREIPNVANDILQFNFAYASHDASRFFINSTIGIFGLFDPATSLGLEHRRADFGQTLYRWGYKKSTYLVLPIIGPTTIRDVAGLGVDYFGLSVWPWVYADRKKFALLTLDYIDIRARLLRREPVLDVLAVDEYTFYRDAYLQHRQYILDGKEAKDDDDDVNPYGDDDNIMDETSEESPKTAEKTKAAATAKTKTETKKETDSLKKDPAKNTTPQAVKQGTGDNQKTSSSPKGSQVEKTKGKNLSPQKKEEGTSQLKEKKVSSQPKSVPATRSN